MPLILALRRQRQADLLEFKTSLVYKENARRGTKLQRNPVSKTKTKQKTRSHCVAVAVLELTM